MGNLPKLAHFPQGLQDFIKENGKLPRDQYPFYSERYDNCFYCVSCSPSNDCGLFGVEVNEEKGRCAEFEFCFSKKVGARG